MREFELIRRFFDRGPARKAVLGIGDDCALVDAGEATLAVSTDMLVEGRHFFADMDPASLGHKALAVNLSDLAAMGAEPLGFTLAMALPRADQAWLQAFSQGLFALADRSGCELVGGDTTQGPLNLSLTVFGRLPRGVALRRDGAQPGDDLWVSGELGGAAHAVRRRYAAMAAAQGLDGRTLAGPDGVASAQALRTGFPADVPALALARLERPEPRLALGMALRHLASSAIDLSDGLLGDLGHLCERSRCGAQLRVERVPLCPGLEGLDARERLSLALTGGDDYELCFTAAPENRPRIRRIGQELGLALTVVGQIDAGDRISLVDEDDRPVAFEGRAHEHFA